MSNPSLRAASPRDRVDRVAGATAGCTGRVVVARGARGDEARRSQTRRVGVRAGSGASGTLGVVRLLGGGEGRLLRLAGSSRSLVVDARHGEDHDRGQDAEDDDDDQQFNEGKTFVPPDSLSDAVHGLFSFLFHLSTSGAAVFFPS